MVAEDIHLDRNRAPGAGRPSVKKTAIPKELEELLADATAGDPISGVKWSRKNPARSATIAMGAPYERKGLPYNDNSFL